MRSQAKRDAVQGALRSGAPKSLAISTRVFASQWSVTSSFWQRREELLFDKQKSKNSLGGVEQLSVTLESAFKDGAAKLPGVKCISALNSYPSSKHRLQLLRTARKAFAALKFHSGPAVKPDAKKVKPGRGLPA